MNKTQKELVKRVIETRPLSSMEAFSLFGITRLAAVIFELRQEGLDIVSIRDEQQRSIQLETWLKASDDARRSLGDKVRNMRDEITENETERAKLRVELERTKELYESLLKEHAQLQADHEKLVRSITDKEAEI